MRLLRIVKHLFGRHLFVTNTVLSGVLFGAGDVIQQKIERTRGINKMTVNDWERSKRLFIVGLMEGPPHHLFYVWLEKVIVKKKFSVSKKLLFHPVC